MARPRLRRKVDAADIALMWRRLLLHCNIKIATRRHVSAITPRPVQSELRTRMPRHGRMSFPRPTTITRAAPATRIAHAEALCAARAQRLTPMRRQVLEVLLASHKPLGAYEIMDAARRGPPPGADHDLSRARFPARQRPRASHREPQRLRRLRAQSRHRAISWCS